MIKAVVFDMDGTLVNSLEDIAFSVNCALAEYGYKSRSLEEIRSFVGNGADMLIKRALPSDGQKDFDKVFNTYRGHYKKNLCVRTKPYDGIIPLLDTLKSMGIKTAVVTNKNDDDAKYIADKLLKNKIDAVVGADLNKRKKKPDPEPVLLALNMLGVSRNEAYYAGDSETDIETARNSDMKCIGCSWGFRERSILEECDFIADKAQDIIKIISEEAVAL